MEREDKSAELYARARRSLAGGISHENRYAEPHPIYMARGQRAYMWDVSGAKYIDYCMGSASLLLGHAHPNVISAIASHASNGTFYGNCHPAEIEWAEYLQAMYPSAERVRFVGSGTEATMLALRLARAHTRRNKILRFEGHYHGWHDYAAVDSMTSSEDPISLGIPRRVSETSLLCPADAQMVEDILRHDSDIACIICEPSGASYGTVPLPPNFLENMRLLADRFGAVLIFDEVISGFRWSPGGIQSTSGITPDLTTLAKVLTGGLPGGALVGRESIMSLLDPKAHAAGTRQRVMHKGTFNASPIISAAAIAVMKLVQTGESQRLADAAAARLRTGMQGIIDDHQVAGVVYGEASTFHLYFGKRDLEGLTSSQIRGVPKETVGAFRRGVRRRGMDLMSYLGGVTSSAHTLSDIDQTLNMFSDTIKELIELNLLQRN